MTQTQQPAPNHAERLPLPARCPVFNPETMRRQLLIDAASRWAVGGLVVMYVFYIFSDTLPTGSDSGASTLIAMALIGVWFTLSISVNRAAKLLPQITAQIEPDPAEAESLLAQALARRALPPTLRLLLYHRLAMLRRRQGRHAETAAICQAVLSQRMNPPRATDAYPSHADPPSGKQGTGRGQAAGGLLGRPRVGGPVRAHLLLLLAEARLECRDALGTYLSLQQLHRCRLTLADLLQLLLVQTRYEIATGHTAAALRQVHRKTQLAEIMPPAQGGAIHALLAVAADRAGKPGLAQWLQCRADLLCAPGQLLAH